MNRMIQIFATGVVVALPALADRLPIVRISDRQTLNAIGNTTTDTHAVPRGPNACCAPPTALDFDRVAFHGQPVGGAATLNPLAFVHPAVINRHGTIAFFSQVSGAERNQGVFTADGNSLTPIAMGCGGGGGSGNPGSGCGDPTPIGGTFSGFFGGTFFAPDINDNGDVLFLADVDGGTAPRGLFLYNAVDDQIVKIAAVGDSSPLGGTLLEVGPGAMNIEQTVVFLARQSGSNAVNYYRWQGGTISLLARVGEAAPQGGTFLFLGRESVGFADGTNVPVGLIPAINDVGQIAFWASTQGGPVERGIVLQNGATRAWHLRNTDPTPVGGMFIDFFGPLLNNAGQIAVFADVRLSQNEFVSGWFVGSPGNYRKALTFFDPLPGGQCFGLAVSRSPINSLDDCGNLLAWSIVQRPDTTEFDGLFLCPPSGAPVPIVLEGAPSDGGGTVGNMNGWQALNDARQYVLSSATPGAPGAFSAHTVVTGLVPGDIDGDRDVDLGDLTLLLANFGQSGVPACSTGDLDCDQDVDLSDLTLFLASFGTDCR